MHHYSTLQIIGLTAGLVGVSAQNSAAETATIPGGPFEPSRAIAALISENAPAATQVNPDQFAQISSDINSYEAVWWSQEPGDPMLTNTALSPAQVSQIDNAYFNAEANPTPGIAQLSQLLATVTGGEEIFDFDTALIAAKQSFHTEIGRIITADLALVTGSTSNSPSGTNTPISTTSGAGGSAISSSAPSPTGNTASGTKSVALAGSGTTTATTTTTSNLAAAPTAAMGVLAGAAAVAVGFVGVALL